MARSQKKSKCGTQTSVIWRPRAPLLGLALQRTRHPQTGRKHASFGGLTEFSTHLVRSCTFGEIPFLPCVRRVQDLEKYGKISLG